ncbi:MAG: hypothetical protein NTZ46_00660 [Verrucomicrobia bacterium]|nr:hypothetical protein [Verrucomicrobiota bacterium]
MVMTLLAGGFIWSVLNIRRGLGIPVAMALGTVTVWYVGDALYNDYIETYMALFASDVLTGAWVQIALFLVAFLFFTPRLHRWVNKDCLKLQSQTVFMFKNGVDQPQFQRGLTLMFRPGFNLWIILIIGAILRFQENIFWYFFPYLGRHPGPWVTAGLGTGKDSLLALANYLQIMVGALFGVVAALSTDKKIRRLALLGVFLIWPYYIFDRTRKSILAVIVPGALGWIFFRIRGGIIKKVSILAVLFIVINAWMGFIISHRLDTSIAEAFSKEGFNLSEDAKKKHEGLNMFEELCWITSLTRSGDYKPEWGGNYLANLANPIPRFIWPGKPTIGIDYAIARGMGGADTAVGVYATLSNGLIGQGIANFGLYAGPAFAAMLVGFWCCWLARLDLLGKKIGYLPLFGLGLITTFAIGRDITFLDLYPCVFGFVICYWLNRPKPPKQYRGPAKIQHTR